METNNKTISLITINLDGKGLLAELLDSVRGLDYPAGKLEIIVVDNGSTDGSVEFLEKSHPEVIIIKNERNLGFAYPCNQGAKAAKGEYLAFVNNDMKLDSSWCREMLKYMDREKNVICVGSKIFNADGTKIDFIGGRISFIGVGYQKNFGKAADFDETEPREILFACGGAMLIDRRIFLEVGGFDEDYFAFYEDIDLGWRLWVMGYKVAFAPSAVAYHKHHQTVKKMSEKVLMTLYERNSIYTIYKNYDDDNLKKALPAALVMSSARLLDYSGIDVSEYLLNGPQMGLFEKRKGNPVKSAYRKALGRALDTLASLTLDFRLKGRVCVPDKGREYCFTPAVAVGQFGFNIERLKKTRDFVQKSRKRSDSEIMEIFKDSFSLDHEKPKSRTLLTLLKGIWDQPSASPSDTASNEPEILSVPGAK
jgi:GT2 family glycosyltransferase